MLNLEFILAGALVMSLTFYVLTAGADFGAGVWSLLAQGPRAADQRKAIRDAIAPIWEANHVWLILVVTVLFTAFPPAFALITTRLHLPLTLLLVGIVLRGVAFAFRTGDIAPSQIGRSKLSQRAHVVLERVFAVSSLVTSILLGVTIGTIASGRLGSTHGGFLDVFVRPWLAPFPLAVGFLALALFAFLAAAYLIVDTTKQELREDFRRRALLAATGVWVLALVVFILSIDGAPDIRQGLAHSGSGRACVMIAGVLGVGAIACLWWRLYRWARFCAAGQATVILWGWAFAQYPYLIEPNLTISDAAAPRQTLLLLLIALLAGALLLFPSLYYLYRVFKPRAIFGESAESGR